MAGVTSLLQGGLAGQMIEIDNIGRLMDVNGDAFASTLLQSPFRDQTEQHEWLMGRHPAADSLQSLQHGMEMMDMHMMHDGDECDMGGGMGEEASMALKMAPRGSFGAETAHNDGETEVQEIVDAALHASSRCENKNRKQQDEHYAGAETRDG